MQKDHIKTGVYEQIINQLFKIKLDEIDEERFYIELFAQCLDYGIYEICIFVRILFISCSNECNFNEMLKIF